MKSSVAPPSVHKKAIALVQASGGGKSKLGVDLCLQGHFLPVYIPLRSMPGSAALPAVSELVKDIEAKELAPNDSDSYQQARAKDDKRVQLVMNFVVSHMWIAHALWETLNTEDDFKQLDDMHKRILYVFAQRGLYKDFSGACIHLNQLDTDGRPDTKGMCIVYDEVTSVGGMLAGHFLHQRKTKDDVADEVYLTTQTRELHRQPAESADIFHSPTDLLYALRRCMNTLLDSRIPQIMMDTHFSIADEVFHREGSQTREMIECVENLPAVAETHVDDWFKTVFGLEGALNNVKGMEAFTGRPRIFYDEYIQSSFLPLLRERRTTELLTLIQESIEPAKKAATRWMRSVINNMANPGAATHSKPMAATICSAFVQAWRQDGVFSVKTRYLQELLSKGLVFNDEFLTINSPSDQEVSISFRKEPLFWETFLVYYKNNATWVLDTVLGTSTRTGSTVGKEMKYAMGWLLYCSHGKPFSDVFKQTSPHVSWFSDATVHVERVCDQPTETQFGQLLSEYGTLIFPQDACGPDIVFTVMDEKAQPTRVYMQVKSKVSKTSFAEALYAVEPRLFYRNSRIELVEECKSAVQPNASVLRAFREDPRLDQRHVRLIMSPEISKGCCLWMERLPAEENRPVVLVMAKDTRIGRSTVFQDYCKSRKSAALRQPAKNVLFKFAGLLDEPQTAAASPTANSKGSGIGKKRALGKGAMKIAGKGAGKPSRKGSSPVRGLKKRRTEAASSKRQGVSKAVAGKRKREKQQQQQQQEEEEEEAAMATTKQRKTQKKTKQTEKER